MLGASDQTHVARTSGASSRRATRSRFFDQYPNLKLIASHAGGALPYLAGRFEKGNEVEIPQRRKMKRKPIDYLRHIYYECITYSPASLEFLSYNFV